MASLKLLLGMIPSTSKIEQAEKALITEFEKLNVFSESRIKPNASAINSKLFDSLVKKPNLEFLSVVNVEE